MNMLPEPLTFEWDEGNIKKNFVKHNVNNKEAEEAITNKPTFLFVDEGHAEKEKRYGLYGKTDNGRRLSIVFTIRREKIRIISARDMSRRERRAYETIEKNSNI